MDMHSVEARDNTVQVCVLALGLGNAHPAWCPPHPTWRDASQRGNQSKITASLRVRCYGSTSDFQSDGAGSTPATRSGLPWWSGLTHKSPVRDAGIAGSNPAGNPIR